jgi:MazG family protein
MATNIDEFIRTVAALRAPDGCPWDREQDHRSLARFVLEEAYEVVEAIHAEEPDKLKEELGDLLLQIVLHAQIASESGQYNMEDIAGGINHKMVSRHPHVFAESTASTSSEVLAQWEDLKRQEAKAKGKADGSIIDTVPNALPALLKALKVSEKAVGQGFEWRDFDELWQKVESELVELKEAVRSGDLNEIELELGDVLFTLVNVARWNKLNPEESLLRAIDKFRLRYRTMEKISTRPLNELTKDELGQMWIQAKQVVGAGETKHTAAGSS